MEDQATTATADQPQSGEVLGNEGTNDSAEQVETSTGTAAESDGLSAGAGEEQDPSEDANWLPDEQQKVFRDEDLARYANSRGNYAKLWALANDQNADPELRAGARQIIHDKLNSDIDRLKLQAQPEAGEVEERDEPVQEKVEEKPLDLKAWDPAVQEYIQKNTDIPRAAQFTDRFIGALQAAASEGATPELKAQAAMTMRGMLWDAMRSDLNLMLTMPGLNGGKSLADSLVESHLTGRDPGFYDHLGATAEQRIWDTIKNSAPEFKNAPSYDSAEFKNLLKEAEKVIPNLSKMTWAGNSAHQNRQMRAQVVLNHFAGKKISVPEVKQALETGQKLERAKQQKVAAGRVTGAGQSKGNTGKPDDRAASFRESILRFREENKPLSTSK